MITLNVDTLFEIKNRYRRSLLLVFSTKICTTFIYQVQNINKTQSEKCHKNLEKSLTFHSPCAINVTRLATCTFESCLST